MLTPPGWLLLGGSGLLVAAGWVFGVDELLAVGVAGAVVAIGSVAYVSCRHPLRVIRRSLEPSHIHVGDDCRVTLEMANHHRLRTPVLHLADEISLPAERSTGLSWSPGLWAAPIPSGESLAISYRLPTEERGQVAIGPLQLTVSDPLGLSARRLRLGRRTAALVYPRVLPIAPPPHRPGREFDAVRRTPMAQAGDELYGLRPFQQGDDPRRIHWRLSAHHDELIVRQFEEFSHSRTVVVLDTRSALLRAEPARERFEAMVSAAASICWAGQRRGDWVRLVTTADFDSGYGADLSHLLKIYEYLALVAPDLGSLAETVEKLGREHRGGQVVAVAAAVDGTEARSLAHTGAQFSSKTVVLFGDARQADTNSAFIPGITLLPVDEPPAFAGVWAAHTASGREASAKPDPSGASGGYQRP
ncbi:MAG: DUF58 domain-containing protein [bacterium]|nr:DUF58 domain-containing protein [bacterium]